MRLTALFTALALVPSAALAQADQLKMILEATKANWVAVRDFDGQDLLYFTHLETYRCGLDGVQYAINGGKMQSWALSKCADPGALVAPIDAAYLPYTSFEPGSVARVTVQITFEDGTRATASYDRKDIETP